MQMAINTSHDTSEVSVGIALQDRERAASLGQRGEIGLAILHLENQQIALSAQPSSNISLKSA
ncbi:hypothetical protein SFOMI_1529 [Sphingobium fuliginis]|uniref:Uncharacterized protein n=1 Tax=Sphingobium fuliginis (strain ATCC 27551) TaxID=336203 RepID=A0A292ZDQ8_SPHSA|nr:hypothetical protein [Sphingobium fuliginis]GAY20999.1 hypothetical protein SFOMI_1529 [Sphingobium fuliginis]